MKRSACSLLIGLSATLVAGVCYAGTNYTVETVQFPGDTFTQLLGINNTDTIAGFHGAAVAEGFTLMLPASYGLLDYPGSSQSMVTAINNTGTVAGIYVDAGGTSHGFTYSGGTFTTVDQPGTVFNQALGINDFNTTVGYSSATDPSGATGETAYSQHGGTFTNINALLPSNQNSQAVGINNAGNIVGFYVSGSDNIGFLDVGGSISTIDPFGSTTAQALGINSSGEIVGFYLDGGGTSHGFTDIGGHFTSFDAPGAMDTVINGINAQGQLVGFYLDASGNTDGFVATPVPLPASNWLLLGGVGSLALIRRRDKALT